MAIRTLSFKSSIGLFKKMIVLPKMKEYKDRYGVDYPDEPPSYEVLMFGATNEGHSVCVAVEKFEPSFYVRLPEKDWRESPIVTFTKRY